MVTPQITRLPRSSRPRETGIIIREQPPQRQQEQAKVETSDETEDPEIRRKGKKPLKTTPKKPSGEPTSLSGKRALLEAAQDRLRNEAWLQRQKDKATGIGGSARGTRSSSASLEVEQDYIVIEEENPPSKMRRVILPSQESPQQSAQPAIQPSSLPLIPLSQE